MGGFLLLTRDTVREQRHSLQVRNYDTGAAPCLYLSKSTGNVWLLLTMGGDCSRWCLRNREGESSECVVFLALSHVWLFSAHDIYEHVSACVCRGVLGWLAWAPCGLITSTS